MINVRRLVQKVSRAFIPRRQKPSAHGNPRPTPAPTPSAPAAASSTVVLDALVAPDDSSFEWLAFLDQFPRPSSALLDDGIPRPDSATLAHLLAAPKKVKITPYARQRHSGYSLSAFVPAPMRKAETMAVLEIALAYVLNNEGSNFVNDALDHGGPTRYGVTQATLSTFQGAPASIADVQNISQQTVAAVYRKLYWTPIAGDKILNQNVATILLDIAVLCGPATAVRLAQQVAGATVDGVMGPKTLEALNQAKPADIVQGLSLSACTYFGAIVLRDASQGKWLVGWQKRAHKMTRLLTT